MARRIREARAAGERRIEVTFDDDSVRVVDAAPLLQGPVFAEIARDDRAFQSMFVDPDFHTVCWPGDLDLAPELLESLPDLKVP
jgi:hypothetical protein